MNPNPITKATQETTEASILDSLLPSTKAPPVLLGPLVGECINDRHPVLLGRYLIRYDDSNGQMIERWLSGLQGLSLRKHDRVILIQPANWPEPVIMGLIDGFAHRPESAAKVAATLNLKPDETIRIESERGDGLVEVRQGSAGPVVRFLSEDVRLETPGKLAFSAKSLEFQATLGKAIINATDDVVITGENVKLN